MMGEILDKIKQAFYSKEHGRNSMGVSESFYDPYYLIKSGFTLEELEAMSNKELENLLKLANHATGAFY
jgi:hypothetical protein